MIRPAATLIVRPREAGDTSFVRTLSEEAFGRWSLEPGRAVRHMMASPHARTLVAELRGRPAGFAVIELRGLDRAYGPIARPVTAHLDAIAVCEADRGRGIGRALLTHAEELAQNERALSMFLMTAVRNRPARRLFERAGYGYLAAVGTAYANAERAVMMMKSL